MVQDVEEESKDWFLLLWLFEVYDWIKASKRACLSEDEVLLLSVAVPLGLGAFFFFDFAALALT